MQKKPKSSRTSIAEDFPAPDIPVTTTMLEGIRSITAHPEKRIANVKKEIDTINYTIICKNSTLALSQCSFYPLWIADAVSGTVGGR
jgi:hypothetical protein